MVYTVKEGDTLYGISKRFGVPLSVLEADNGIADPAELVVGESLVVSAPSVIYTVKSGDTVESVAELYSTSTREIFRNNPALGGRDLIYPGQSLVITRREAPPYGRMSLNGYAYPFIDDDVLRSALPYLTYLSVFTTGIKNDGTLIPPDGAERLVDTAREYGVKPIMVLTSLGEDGNFSNELTMRVLSSDEISRRVIDSAAEAVRAGGYDGIDVDFEYISGEYAGRYADFIRSLKDALGESYEVFVSLAPKVSDDMSGILYEGHDYRALGAAADRALLMTYEWGYTYGPPQAVAPLDKVREVVDYALSRIPAGKIFLGTPNYGYDFKLPYVRGESEATPLSNAEALSLAKERRAAIEYDETSEAPFFVYYDRENGRSVRHIVWFESPRSVEATGILAAGTGLAGISVWNIMKFFPGLFTQLASMFEIV